MAMNSFWRLKTDITQWMVMIRGPGMGWKGLDVRRLMERLYDGCCGAEPIKRVREKDPHCSRMRLQGM